MINDFQNLLEFVLDTPGHYLGVIGLIIVFKLNLPKISSWVNYQLRALINWITYIITGRR